MITLCINQDFDCQQQNSHWLAKAQQNLDEYLGEPEKQVQKLPDREPHRQKEHPTIYTARMVMYDYSEITMYMVIAKRHSCCWLLDVHHAWTWTHKSQKNRPFCTCQMMDLPGLSTSSSSLPHPSLLQVHLITGTQVAYSQPSLQRVLGKFCFKFSLERQIHNMGSYKNAEQITENTEHGKQNYNL